jgi:branched-chain amino acid transport system permease protein
MAGLAGILWAIDQNMTPTMGMRALLIGVVAMIIGGQKTVSGVVLASMFLALAQNYSILFVPTAWQDAIVFLILVAFLLVSPSGFFGLRGRRRSLT